MNPYYLFQQYNNDDYVDDNVTLLNGTIDLKFKRQPKNETKPSNNLPYEVKRIIEEDFEYISYGEMGNKKSMSLREGSWGDFYIEFENLTLNELKEIVLPLSENVAEALDDKGIKGYGELGLNSYGNAIDIEVSEDNEKDTDTYAKGGGLGRDFDLPALFDELDALDDDILRNHIYKGETYTESMLRHKAKQIAYNDYCDEGVLKDARKYISEASSWYRDNKRYAKGGSLTYKNDIYYLLYEYDQKVD